MLHIKAFQAAPNLNLVRPKEPKPAELDRGKPAYKPIFAAAKAQVERYTSRSKQSPSITITCTKCHPK